MIVKFYFGNGYVGCDQEEMMFYPKDTPARMINIDVNEWGHENADSYAYVALGWEEDYTEEEYEDYVNNCDWGWHDATWEEYVEYCENWRITPNEDWREEE